MEYQTNSTLAGRRLKTNLKDIASSITVVTRQFLDDSGVKVTLQGYSELDETSWSNIRY